MKRILLIASLAGLLSGTTGCLHHNARRGCNHCGPAAGCPSGNCGHGHGGGLLGRLGGHCGPSGVAVGCRPAPLRWQQGGLDYSAGLATGALGHGAAAAMQAQPVNPGPPTGTVAYPYYTVRGPRDFLLDNPPSIGR